MYCKYSALCRQLLVKLALQYGGEKTPAGIAKRIYPVLEEETETEGADIQQCPMMQTGENVWVWRPWTPQDIMGLKANMEEHLKENPRKAIKILHDQIMMHGATRTDIGFICTAVLPSSVWGAHSAAWGVKPEHEVDGTLNQRNLPVSERAAQTVYKDRVGGTDGDVGHRNGPTGDRLASNTGCDARREGGS